jgi:hypothetical protein
MDIDEAKELKNNFQTEINAFMLSKLREYQQETGLIYEIELKTTRVPLEDDTEMVLQCIMLKIIY